MRELLKLSIGKRVDWREGSMGDTDIPSNPEMPDVTIGLHKNSPAPAYEDEEETIARKNARKRPMIQSSKTWRGALVYRSIFCWTIANVQSANSTRMGTARQTSKSPSPPGQAAF